MYRSTGTSRAATSVIVEVYARYAHTEPLGRYIDNNDWCNRRFVLCCHDILHLFPIWFPVWCVVIKYTLTVKHDYLLRVSSVNCVLPQLTDLTRYMTHGVNLSKPDSKSSHGLIWPVWVTIELYLQIIAVMVFRCSRKPPTKRLFTFGRRKPEWRPQQTDLRLIATLTFRYSRKPVRYVMWHCPVRQAETWRHSILKIAQDRSPGTRFREIVRGCAR